MFQQALLEAVRGLDPRAAVRRPLLLGVLLGAALATVLAGLQPGVFTVATAAFIWLVLVVISLGAATVDVRARALIERLRSDRDVTAKRIKELRPDAPVEHVPVSQLRRGDFVKVGAGDTVPVDGDVVAGIATIKSPLSGRSAPLVRESGGERRVLVAGASVLSDWLIFDVWSNPGEDFRERLLALGERARRSIAIEPRGLGVLTIGMMLIGLAATAQLQPWVALAETNDPRPMLVVLGLLACSLPATYAGLQAALDVAGFDRLLRINVVACTADVVRAIGEVSVLLLDKASVRMRGNCEAAEFKPMPGVEPEELAEAAFFASLADETPEGRSIVALAEKSFGLVPGAVAGAQFHGYSSLTHLAGADLHGRQIRKGDADAIRGFVREHSSAEPPDEVRGEVQRIAGSGGIPLVVADGARVLGIVRLTCPVRERLTKLRAGGMMAIVSTADNAKDAAALAAEAGADWFVPQATPEAKLAEIRRYQAQGRKVAMVGDGGQDGPAMAQADVSIALNAGSLAAREAGSLIDLDADPTKLISVVEVGTQMRRLRRTLTAWCLASDLAVGLALVPLVISGAGGAVSPLNPLGLCSRESAVLAGLIVHTLVLAGVVPLALRGPGLLKGPLAAAPVAALSTLAAIKLFDLGLSLVLAS